PEHRVMSNGLTHPQPIIGRRPPPAIVRYALWLAYAVRLQRTEAYKPSRLLRLPAGPRGRRRPMQVADIMHRDVVTVRPEETFFGAARVMSDHRVSSVVVVHNDHGAAGVITE